MMKRVSLCLAGLALLASGIPGVAMAQMSRPAGHAMIRATSLGPTVSMLNQCGDTLDGRAEVIARISSFTTVEQEKILKAYDSSYKGTGKPIVKDCKSFKADSARQNAQKILADIERLAGSNN